MTQQRVLVLCGWLMSSGALAKAWKAGDLAIVEQDGRRTRRSSSPGTARSTWCSFNNGNAYNCSGVPYSGRAVTYKDGADQACDMSGGVPLNCDGVSYSGKAVLMRKE